MLRFIAVFVGIACLFGCAAAPVQEMSDARQAIVAARAAGATEGNSPDLYAADAAIARAEQHLQAQEYARARLEAMQAKRHAAAALHAAPASGTLVHDGGSAAASPPSTVPAAGSLDRLTPDTLAPGVATPAIATQGVAMPGDPMASATDPGVATPGVATPAAVAAGAVDSGSRHFPLQPPK